MPLKVNLHSLLLLRKWLPFWPLGIGLFFILLVPFVHFGASIDPHHSVGFVAFLLGLTLLLFERTTVARLDRKFALVVVFCLLLAAGFGKDVEDALVLAGISFILCLHVQLKGFHHFLRVFWGFYACVLILLLGRIVLIDGSLSHGSSYEVQPLFAHRNIALECFALLSFANAYSRPLKTSAAILALATALTLLFQSRAALITILLAWLVIFFRQLWKDRNIRRMSLLLVVSLAAFQAYHLMLPWEAYKKSFDRLPDGIKALDLRYNFRSATSSSERVEIWSWTIREARLFGHGLGSWKFDAQGAVNQAIGKEELVIRRPHSEVIRGIYEFGWIPFCLALGLFCYHFRHRWRLMLVAMPAFLFSFPLERAEHLSALWLAAMALPCRTENAPTLGKRWVANALSVSLLFFFFTWAYSQHLYGKLMQGATTLQNMPSKERSLLEVFSHDPALNRLLTYQLVELKQRGRTFSQEELEKLVPSDMRHELWYLKLTTANY